MLQLAFISVKQRRLGQAEPVFVCSLSFCFRHEMELSTVREDVKERLRNSSWTTDILAFIMFYTLMCFEVAVCKISVGLSQG